MRASLFMVKHEEPADRWPLLAESPSVSLVRLALARNLRLRDLQAIGKLRHWHVQDGT